MCLDHKEGPIAGSLVFELYDTFGFPPDLTGLILKERGLSFNEREYEAAMTQQKERARASSKIDTGDWVVIEEDDKEEFVGYDQSEAKVRITRYREVISKKKKQFQLVLNLTPFYPEGGGQVGDQGKLVSEIESLEILDTKKEHGLIIHFSNKLPEDVSISFQAIVNEKKRDNTSLNHSATHLLHQALREILGRHVEQKGSLVNEQHLRFDFSHFSKLSPEEIEAIENLVNQRIRANFPLEEFRQIPIDDAKEMGAMALFGEKYGDTVRAIKFGESIELCGGMHVAATGNIGVFTIVSEGAVAAGIRRLEAYTGAKAQEFYRSKVGILSEVQQELKNPKDTLGAINSLKNENHDLKKQLDAFLAAQAAQEKKNWAASLETINGFERLISESRLDAKSVKDALFQLKAEHPRLIAVVGTRAGEKAQIAVAIGDELLKEKDWKAGNLVKEFAAEIRGGGGGQAAFAMAGGSYADGLNNALKKANELLN
jgi:alanyl-tRNA synthetase